MLDYNNIKNTNMELNDQSFKEKIENGQGLAIIDFYAPWCGPCKMMAPIIDELIEEYKDKNVVIAKVNVDECREVAEKYNIMSIPTLGIFKDGKTIDLSVGLKPREEIKMIIDKNI